MKTTSESTAHITKMDLLYIQTHYNCQIWIQESWGAVGPRSSRPGGFVGQWLLQFPGISGALAGAIWKPMASVIRVCSSKASAAGCNLHKDMMWADVMWYHIIGTYMRYLYISYLYINIYINICILITTSHLEHTISSKPIRKWIVFFSLFRRRLRTRSNQRIDSGTGLDSHWLGFCQLKRCHFKELILEFCATRQATGILNRRFGIHWELAFIGTHWNVRITWSNPWNHLEPVGPGRLHLLASASNTESIPKHEGSFAQHKLELE